MADARHIPLADETVQTVVTSPPYWGLREYWILPRVWGGEVGCAHDWDAQFKQGGGAYAEGSKKRWQHAAEDFGRDDRFLDGHPAIPAGSLCERCGAWAGTLGLEPTPDLYIAHLVDVFREVWRVLKPDGTLWLNLGDCYATGAGKVGEHPGGGEQGARWRGDVDRLRDEKRGYRGAHLPRGEPINKARGTAQPKLGMGPMTQPNRMPIVGLKPKDLCMMPARVAMALQADGWYLRADIIWSKPNPMPESVQDRPTKAHEYLYLLSKRGRYYYDGEAIKEPCSYGHEAVYDPGTNGLGGEDRRTGTTTRRFAKPPAGWNDGPTHEDRIGRYSRSGNKARVTAQERGCPEGTGKNQASSVPWEGILRNKRSVWTVNTEPYPGAHFATFPVKLIEPCILAGSRPGDVVLDPFVGSGTTCFVAERFGRKAVGLDLSRAYLTLAQQRLHGQPLALPLGG